MSEHLEKQITDATRVSEFISDPVIKEALERIHQQAYREFRAAVKPEDIMAANAKSRALDAIATELRSVQDRGAVARAELERSTPRNSPRNSQKAL